MRLKGENYSNRETWRQMDRVQKAVLVNVLILLIIFLTVGVRAASPTDEKVVENLMSQRIEILGRYYAGAEGFDRTERRLEKIESGGLLKDDLNAMKENRNTDFSRVKKYSIDIYSCSRSNYGILTGEMEMNWIMESMAGAAVNVGVVPVKNAKYFFAGESNASGTKLTRIEIK